MNHEIKIGNRIINKNSGTYVIAEMSGNHNMDYNRAIEIVKAAAEAGADAIKVQTYTADTITLDCNDPCFQITQGTLWDGTTLHKLYEKAYTPWEWQPKLQKIAEDLGLDFFSSPFDFTSVDFLEKMNVPAYKIASFELTDIPLIKKVAELGKPVIMSTGIALPEDIELALETCKKAGNENVILLKCCSAYPTPYEDINLRTMVDMASKYDCTIGLSDHTMGSAVSVAAVAMGAKLIEKHLTLARADGGVDSAFSMEPAEFKEMVDNIRIVEKAKGKVTYDLAPKQMAEREHARSLFIAADIKAGEILTPENLRSVRPANGLHTKYYEELLGRKVVRDCKYGEPMSWDMVE
ncbi:N-acetylneuraminate synthase [Lachnospiraceae bacterium G11]|nr:N-acetylneuraminate synthase [Lachnospiraceae bacterium G11]